MCCVLYVIAGNAAMHPQMNAVLVWFETEYTVNKHASINRLIERIILVR